MLHHLVVTRRLTGGKISSKSLDLLHFILNGIDIPAISAQLHPEHVY